MKSNLTIPLQIKRLSDREFEGHGSIFGNEDLGGDVVVPGAFKRSLAQHRKSGSLPQMFWMHDPSRVPGKWLTMKEDKEGLKVKGTLAETPLGDEIRTLLKMDAVKGLSIGYRTIDQDFDEDGRRLLKEIELWEVSVVSLPMNPLAQVAHAKSQLSAIGEYVPTPREFERILRDVGCSQMVAKRIMSKLAEDEQADQTNQVGDRMADATIVATMSNLFERISRDVGCSQKVAKRMMSNLLIEGEKVEQTDSESAQVTDEFGKQLTDATIVAKMSKLFEDEESARDVKDSPRDVEVDEKESDAPRDVAAIEDDAVDADDADAAKAANRIAEQLWAMTIRTPRI